MSKILAASCVDNKVTVEGKEIEGAIILSQGKASSTGIVIIEEDKVTYIAMNTTDLATTIDKTVELINAIAPILTAIGAGMTGPMTAPPPTLAADVAQLQTKASELLQLKDNLK